MKPIRVLLALGLLGGCASGQYYDTSAAVDTRPECAGADLDASAAPWCQRATGRNYTVGGDRTPIDFDGDDESR